MISYKKLVTRNNEALTRLSVGMTKTEVIQVMGDYVARTHNGVVNNPLRVESLTKSNDIYEKLFYL
ncbi:MAG: hypothetical protein ABUL58_02745, partial [Steroidobacter sp.]